MTETTITNSITAAVEATTFPTASARKTGRDPRWPYVPVLILPNHLRTTQQIRNRAFATRDEAVAHAAAVVEANRISLSKRLADPRERALREHHGLPREIAEVRA